MSGGHQKSRRCPPPGVDSDQQASGPWSTPNRVVKAAAVAILEQPGSEESLADRRLDLCWSPWAVEDKAQPGEGKRPGKKPRASEAWTRSLQQGGRLRSAPNSRCEYAS